MINNTERQRVFYLAKTKTAKVIPPTSTNHRLPYSSSSASNTKRYQAPLASIEPEAVTRRENGINKSSLVREKSSKPVTDVNVRGDQTFDTSSGTRRGDYSHSKHWTGSNTYVTNRVAGNYGNLKQPEFAPNQINSRSEKILSYEQQQPKSKARVTNGGNFLSDDQKSRTAVNALREETSHSVESNSYSKQIIDKNVHRTTPHTTEHVGKRQNLSTQEQTLSSTSPPDSSNHTRTYPTSTVTIEMKPKSIQSENYTTDTSPVSPASKLETLTTLQEYHIDSSNNLYVKILNNSSKTCNKKHDSTSKPRWDKSISHDKYLTLPTETQLNQETTNSKNTNNVGNYSELLPEMIPYRILHSDTDPLPEMYIQSPQVTNYHPPKSVHIMSSVHASQIPQPNRNTNKPSISVDARLNTSSHHTQNDKHSVQYTHQNTKNFSLDNANSHKTLSLDNNTFAQSSLDNQVYTRNSLDNTISYNQLSLEDERIFTNNIVRSGQQKAYQNSTECEQLEPLPESSELLSVSEFKPRWKRNSLRLATLGYTSMSDLANSLECISGHVGNVATNVQSRLSEVVNNKNKSMQGEISTDNSFPDEHESGIWDTKSSTNKQEDPSFVTVCTRTSHDDHSFDSVCPHTQSHDGNSFDSMCSHTHPNKECSYDSAGSQNRSHEEHSLDSRHSQNYSHEEQSLDSRSSHEEHSHDSRSSHEKNSFDSRSSHEEHSLDSRSSHEEHSLDSRSSHEKHSLDSRSSHNHSYEEHSPDSRSSHEEHSLDSVGSITPSHEKHSFDNIDTDTESENEDKTDSKTLDVNIHQEHTLNHFARNDFKLLSYTMATADTSEMSTIKGSIRSHFNDNFQSSSSENNCTDLAKVKTEPQAMQFSESDQTSNKESIILDTTKQQQSGHVSKIKRLSYTLATSSISDLTLPDLEFNILNRSSVLNCKNLGNVIDYITESTNNSICSESQYEKLKNDSYPSRHSSFGSVFSFQSIDIAKLKSRKDKNVSEIDYNPCYDTDVRELANTEVRDASPDFDNSVSTETSLYCTASSNNSFITTEDVHMSSLQLRDAQRLASILPAQDVEQHNLPSQNRRSPRQDQRSSKLSTQDKKSNRLSLQDQRLSGREFQDFKSNRLSLQDQCLPGRSPQDQRSNRMSQEGQEPSVISSRDHTFHVSSLQDHTYSVHDQASHKLAEQDQRSYRIQEHNIPRSSNQMPTRPQVQRSPKQPQHDRRSFRQFPHDQGPLGQYPHDQRSHGQSPHDQRSLRQSQHDQRSRRQSPHDTNAARQSPHEQRSLRQETHDQKSLRQEPHDQRSLRQEPHDQRSLRQEPHNQRSLKQSPYDQRSPRQSQHDQRSPKQLPDDQRISRQSPCSERQHRQDSHNQRPPIAPPHDQRYSRLSSYDQRPQNMSSYHQRPPNMSSHDQKPRRLSSHDQRPQNNRPSHEQRPLDLSLDHQRSLRSSSDDQRSHKPSTEYQRSSRLSSHDQRSPGLSPHDQRSPNLSPDDQRQLNQSPHDQTAPKLLSKGPRRNNMASNNERSYNTYNGIPHRPHDQRPLKISAQDQKSLNVSSPDQKSPNMLSPDQKSPNMSSHDKKSSNMSSRGQRSQLISSNGQEYSNTSRQEVTEHNGNRDYTNRKTNPLAKNDKLFKHTGPIINVLQCYGCGLNDRYAAQAQSLWSINNSMVASYIGGTGKKLRKEPNMHVQDRNGNDGEPSTELVRDRLSDNSQKYLPVNIQTFIEADVSFNDALSSSNGIDRTTSLSSLSTSLQHLIWEDNPRLPPQLGRPRRKLYAGFDSQPLPMDTCLSESSSMYSVQSSGSWATTRSAEVERSPRTSPNIRAISSIISGASTPVPYMSQDDVLNLFTYAGKSFSLRENTHNLYLDDCFKNSSYDKAFSNESLESCHSDDTTVGADQQDVSENVDFKKIGRNPVLSIEGIYKSANVNGSEKIVNRQQEMNKSNNSHNAGLMVNNNSSISVEGDIVNKTNKLKAGRYEQSDGQFYRSVPANRSLS